MPTTRKRPVGWLRKWKETLPVPQNDIDGASENHLKRATVSNRRLSGCSHKEIPLIIHRRSAHDHIVCT